jgi:capsular polysaccharide export protein
MDVLFISKRGSMYKYFQYLKNNLDLRSTVLDFTPKLYIKLKASPPSVAEINAGTKFHLQRKKAKYNFPEWLWRLLGFYYGCKFKFYYRQFSAVIDHHNPRCIALWNGHRLPEQAIKVLAQKFNIPVVHFENGLLPDTTTFDLSGVNDANSLPRNAQFYRQYKNESTVIERQLVSRKFHRSKKSHAKNKSFYADLPEKFIFVPFQVKFDSQVLLNSKNIKTMTGFYQWLEFAEKSSDQPLKFVIKEHPSDPHKYTELYNKNPNIIFSNRDTKELIEKSDAVITVNSSVGLEAILLHKRVIVLGEACYGIEGLCHPVKTEQRLSEVINQLSSWQLDIDLVENFLAYLTREYCVPTSWRNPDRKHIDSLRKKFKAI